MKFLNHKLLLISIILIVAISALLGLAQLWFTPLATTVFIKTLITLGIGGLLAGFLVAVDYDWPEQRMKPVFFGLITLAVITGGLLIAKLWGVGPAADLFVKILITLGVLMGLLALILAIFEDFGSHKSLRDDKYID